MYYYCSSIWSTYSQWHGTLAFGVSPDRWGHWVHADRDGVTWPLCWITWSIAFFSTDNQPKRSDASQQPESQQQSEGWYSARNAMRILLRSNYWTSIGRTSIMQCVHTARSGSKAIGKWNVTCGWCTITNTCAMTAARGLEQRPNYSDTRSPTNWTVKCVENTCLHERHTCVTLERRTIHRRGPVRNGRVKNVGGHSSPSVNWCVTSWSIISQLVNYSHHPSALVSPYCIVGSV